MLRSGEHTMTTQQLSDSQRQILVAACERRSGLVLPVATALRGGALAKVFGSLLSRGFVKEVRAAAKGEVWQTTEDGIAVTLKLTKAGSRAVGIERGAGRVGSAEPGRRPERAGTKQAQVIALLQRPEGATIQQIAEATGW